MQRHAPENVQTVLPAGVLLASEGSHRLPTPQALQVWRRGMLCPGYTGARAALYLALAERTAAAACQAVVQKGFLGSPALWCSD